MVLIVCFIFRAGILPQLRASEKLSRMGRLSPVPLRAERGKEGIHRGPSLDGQAISCATKDQ